MLLKEAWKGRGFLERVAEEPVRHDAHIRAGQLPSLNCLQKNKNKNSINSVIFMSNK